MLLAIGVRGGITIEIDRRQIVAARERTVLDAGDAVGDGYSGQADAESERPVPNAGE